MNKKYNPTLLNTVVSGPGMKYPRKPLVLLGNDGEFAQGDLMDANAVLEAIDDAISGESGISKKLDKEIRDREAAINNLETSFTSTLQGYINGGSYNSSTQKIELKNGNTVIASIDADQFITDGMVDDVRIENGNLIIDFNTASGKQDILIPLTDIFNPSNYYTKTEINSALSGKQNTIDDLANIRSGAQAGLTAYLKPQIGIPATDLEAAVQTSLGKADTALQSYTETDPTVPAWAKAANKPTYNYSEISNTPTLATVATSGSYNDLSNKPTILTVASASDVEEGTSTEKALTPSNMNKIKAEVTDSIMPDPTAGHEYVDLGLPSGTLWATMNVGALSETDYGNYYMYGMGSKTYDSTDTPYAGTEDPLAASADTAAQEWGGGWHMPTRAQMEELTANTTYQWVTNYKGSGINGVLFTSKTNENMLFIPAAGFWYNGDVSSVGSGSYFWGSSSTNSDYAYYMFFDDTEDSLDEDLRTRGYSVRGVLDDSITPPSKLHKVAVTGNYNDLENKPTIPTVPTNISAFNNDVGYVTSATAAEVAAGTATNKALTPANLNDILTVFLGKEFGDTGHTINWILQYVADNAHVQPKPVEGDVQIFLDSECTEYATGVVDKVYARVNVPWGYGGAWSIFIDDAGRCITCAGPDSEVPDDPYFMSVYQDFGSDDYNEPFTAGQVVELTKSFGPVDVTGYQTVFTRPS